MKKVPTAPYTPIAGDAIPSAAVLNAAVAASRRRSALCKIFAFQYMILLLPNLANNPFTSYPRLPYQNENAMLPPFTVSLIGYSVDLLFVCPAILGWYTRQRTDFPNGFDGTLHWRAGCRDLMVHVFGFRTLLMTCGVLLGIGAFAHAPLNSASLTDYLATAIYVQVVAAVMLASETIGTSLIHNITASTHEKYSETYLPASTARNTCCCFFANPLSRCVERLNQESDARSLEMV